MYDLIIIGAGPSGTAAAIYSARKQLKTLLITKEFGGQSSVSPEIYNWIGTPKISGYDLAKNFKTHVKEYEGDFLQIVEGQNVHSTSKSEDGSYQIITESGEKFSAKTLLVASGSSRRKLAIPGAEEYENKGVVYCASCDGPLFSGMDTVVIGGGNAGFESASQLLAYAKSVTLIHRSEQFRADEVTIKKVLSHPKMTALKNTEPISIQGDQMVKSITVKNKLTNKESVLETSGVFVEIGQIPNTDYLGELVEKDKYNRITIDPWTQKTSADGIWSAGDCTTVLFHQNNIAAGDGVRALEDIYLHLHAR